MPKNKGKGGKRNRRAKTETEDSTLVLKSKGEAYAQVIRMLGNGRLEAVCFNTSDVARQGRVEDGGTQTKRLCHICGKMRKKIWVSQGDIILIELRDYQDAKADVIRKYNAQEVAKLKSLGEIPRDVVTDEDKHDVPETDCGFEFIQGVDSEEEIPDSKVANQPQYEDLPNYSDTMSSSSSHDLADL
jgi:translation initiation factor 1A